MVHQKYPVLGGLALGLVLLSPQLVSAISTENGALKYSGVLHRELAPELKSRLEGQKTAQNTTSTSDSETSTDARKKLRKELDRIRRDNGEANNSQTFDPPKPVRRKANQATPAVAEANDQQWAANHAIDAETDRLIGRLIFMQFKGSQPSDGGPKAIKSLLQSGLISGAMFSNGNIQSKAQLKELMKFFWQGGGAPKPIFAIREIGGTSDALPAIRDFEQWPSEKDVAARGDPEYAYSTYRSMGANLAVLGFNVNFGPALGDAANAPNPSASFSTNALQAGVFAKTFLLGHREENVIPVPVVDGGPLSVRALKTLLVSYPETPIAAKMTNDIKPFAAYEGLVRGARFCFVSTSPGNDGADAAANFNRGCDVLVVDGGNEPPTAARDRVAQSVSQAMEHGELTLDALNASAQRLFTLRSSLASLH